VIWVAILYAPVRHFDFAPFDDGLAIVENPQVRAGLTAGGVRWSLGTFTAYNWQPATWWSHMLDVSLFGMDAGRHHQVNVLLHAANAALLFQALRTLTGALWPAALAAALFALHPLRVESVAWIAERKDVLSTALWLLATLAWVRWVRRPSAARYAAAAALLALGLMAKPMLVTFPASLLVLDYWPLGRAVGRGRVPWGRLVVEKVPLFGLALGSAAVTFLAQRAGGAVSALEVVPLAGRAANAVRAYGWYLLKEVWPTDLAVPYLLPMNGWPVWQVAGAGAALVALTALAVQYARRWPHLAVGWAWYVGTLVPVVGLVQVGSQAMADRYTYVPLIGVAVAVAFGLADLHRAVRPHPAVVGVAAAAVLAALSTATAAQLRHWRNGETLLARSIAVVPGNYQAHNNLGLLLAAKRRWAEAAEQYRQALSIAPGEGLPRYNHGLALEALGRTEEAAREYQTALITVQQPAAAAKVHASLGAALERLGRRAEGTVHFERALSLDPASGQAAYNLGTIRLQEGRAEEAAALLGAVVRSDPGNAAARNNLAYAFVQLGRAAEAVREYEALVAIAPGDPEARRNLEIARTLVARPGAGAR
jgi:tetratricopeptide (TPR) repeat protein